MKPKGSVIAESSSKSKLLEKVDQIQINRRIPNDTNSDPITLLKSECNFYCAFSVYIL